MYMDCQHAVMLKSPQLIALLYNILRAYVSFLECAFHILCHKIGLLCDLLRFLLKYFQRIFFYYFGIKSLHMFYFYFWFVKIRFCYLHDHRY